MLLGCDMHSNSRGSTAHVWEGRRNLKTTHTHTTHTHTCIVHVQCSYREWSHENLPAWELLVLKFSTSKSCENVLDKPSSLLRIRSSLWLPSGYLARKNSESNSPGKSRKRFDNGENEMRKRKGEDRKAHYEKKVQNGSAVKQGSCYPGTDSQMQSSSGKPSTRQMMETPPWLAVQVQSMTSSYWSDSISQDPIGSAVHVKQR